MSIEKSEATVTVSILGGLGNQMFQYAAAKSLACRKQAKLVLDSEAFQTYELRSFLLDRLMVPETVEIGVTDASTMGSGRLSAMLWRNRANRLLTRLSLPSFPERSGIYSEPSFQFDPGFFDLRCPISIFGYFQSERYFIDIANDLRQFFKPRDVLGDGAQVVSDMIAGSPMPISLHIRRGDYVQSEATARVHGSLASEYYVKALQFLQGWVGVPMNLFVFSDDPDEAAALLHHVPKTDVHYVRGDPDRPWEDMQLMSQCRHHVIANSSFSWWGAWLNARPDKIVIAPRAWFSAPELRKRNICDLHPRDWILI